MLGSLTEREFIQNLGHGARLTFGDDFWVDQVLPKPGINYIFKDKVVWRADAALRAMYPNTDVLVLSDLRYENEAQRVLDLGGVIWQVSRPGFFSDGHESEQPLPP